MSKSILGTVLFIAGFALELIPGIGTALHLGLIAGLSAATVIGTGLVIAGGLLMAPAKPKGLSTGVMGEKRLTASLVPTEPRKIVFGDTALPNDKPYRAFTK